MVRRSNRRQFRRDRKRWRLRQQRCLEVASRPAMSAQSMGCVGLIDITVGNAARLGASQRSTRDAARRTTSLRNARAAGHIPAAFARLARTVRLKRLWLRDDRVKRIHASEGTMPITKCSALECGRAVALKPWNANRDSERSHSRVHCTCVEWDCP